MNKTRLFTYLVCLELSLGVAHAVTTFSTPVTLVQGGAAPGPTLAGGVLTLTTPSNHQNNIAAFDLSDPGYKYTATFSFSFRISNQVGENAAADGFSFNFADTRLHGTAGAIVIPRGEEPNAPGILGIAFDTWNNETDPGVDGPGLSQITLHYDGALVLAIDDTRLLPTPFSLTDGGIHNVAGVVDFRSGAVSLTVDGQVILNQVVVPGLASMESRIAFAGRTGGASELVEIRDLAVSFAPEPELQPILGQGDVTRPDDPLILVNGINDGDNFLGPPPAGEGPEHAIDNQAQKYLNFLDLGSGIAVQPRIGLTVVTGLRLYTANDEPSRDPASVLLEGSAGGLGGPWVTIFSGLSPLPDARNAWGPRLLFPNTNAYAAYRLTFPTLKNAAAANSMQIGEVELIGVPYGPSFASDFNAGLPSDASVFQNGDPPAPSEANGVLHLTEASGGQNNMFLVGDFNQSQTVGSFVAKFKVRIGNAFAGGPADGFSFSFGPDINPASFAGEEGAGSGLRVTFDTWDNGPLTPENPVSDFDAPSIEVVYNNQRRGTVSMAGNRFNGRAPATAIPIDPATGQPMSLVTGDTFADVEIWLSFDGTVEVSYKGVRVLSISTGYRPTAGRFALAARTGGAFATHYVDDLSIFSLEGPRLSIEPLANGNVRVYWPLSAAGFLLDQTSNLVAAPAAVSWDLVPPSSYQTDATHASITVTPGGNRFYRLRRP